MGLIALPASEPSISCRDGKRVVSFVPNAVEREPLNSSGDQREQISSGDTGMSNEVTPENGKSASAAFVATAI